MLSVYLSLCMSLSSLFLVDLCLCLFLFYYSFNSLFTYLFSKEIRNVWSWVDGVVESIFEEMREGKLGTEHIVWEKPIFH